MPLPHVVLLLVLGAVQAEAQRIIFPDKLRYSEGEVCITKSGQTSTCERSCQDASSQSVDNLCGYQDLIFLFCCEKKLDSLTDISPPALNFQCGKSIKNNEPGTVGPVPRPALPPGPATAEGQVNPLELPLPAFQGSGSDLIHQAVGGVNTRENAWPWMALIGIRDAQGISWFCAGVLINEQWILSALHCFLNQNIDVLVVRLGEHDYNSLSERTPHQDFGVIETVFYPDYSHPQAYHDLAMLRLDSRVSIQRSISPVCLPWGKESDRVLTNQVVTLTGWGDTKFGGQPSSILQEVKVTVFSPTQCDRSYSNLPQYAETWPQGIGQETVCAGDPNGGRDACQGDSGGPLVSQDARGSYVLAGVVSRGYGCGHKDYPGLYANLRYPPYLAWIKKVAFTTI
ncbi:hypothetical protein O3P69_007129 [Scylla paramamosain]|uniref:limulus clotting factor C n=1 Tax=Scylla paramamosain TaxID=85552 RepID=A0AAW0V1H3_SCYPA